MASLIVRRNAARHILSIAKTPSSTPSLPTGIPTSCRFQSTTSGPTTPPTTATTVPTVPRPNPYRPAYSPATPTTPRPSTPATPRPTTPASSTNSTIPRPTTSATSTNNPPPTTPTTPTTPRPAAPSHAPPPRENHAPTAANAFKSGLNDLPPIDLPEEGGVDWARSFSGLSEEPFSEDIKATLMASLNHTDIEIKPDGIIYLPEIKYRRILNNAFGPGGWGLAPRSDTIITNNSVTREYGLVCHGRLVSIARGEQDYFDPSGIPTATEGCKSNAMMRCCKDLGIASELWDPRFIRKFKKEMCSEVMAEHMITKKRKKVWVRKGDMVEYPFKQA